MKSILFKGILFFLFPAIALSQNSSTDFQPLLQAARKTHSSSLIVINHGEQVVDYHYGDQHWVMNTMSMTKSVIGLGIMRLLTQGTIDSLITPVATFYPEWRQGQKDKITIRHLLNQTSGLQDVSSAREEIHPSPDVVQLALCASVVDTPGTQFDYNNKAVNLLSGVVHKATGQMIDQYLESELFKPLSIERYEWKTDKAGNHLAMSGLKLSALAMAKIGQLVLQNGNWEGRQLIDSVYVQKMLDQGSPEYMGYGLMWWRIPKTTEYTIDQKQIEKLREAGFREEWVDKITTLQGTYDSKGALGKAFMSTFSRREFVRLRKQMKQQNVQPWHQTIRGPIVGYEASGDFGQYLVIYPEQEVVAVRMIRVLKDYNRKTDSFSRFPDMVYNLAN